MQLKFSITPGTLNSTMTWRSGRTPSLLSVISCFVTISPQRRKLLLVCEMRTSLEIKNTAIHCFMVKLEVS